MTKQTLREIKSAHTNLNIFSAIQSILEGGHIYGDTNKAAGRIIQICNKEMQRQLKLMDVAEAKLYE